MSLLEGFGFGIALLGAVVVLLGALGVVRFPDLFTRMHAAGVIDTFGAMLVLFGLCLAAGVSTETARMLLILAFLWVTSPTACHALAKTARAAGQEPHVALPPVPDLEGTHGPTLVPSAPPVTTVGGNEDHRKENRL